MLSIISPFVEKLLRKKYVFWRYNRITMLFHMPLRYSHQILRRPRLWNVAMHCPLLLPHKVTIILFCSPRIHISKLKCFFSLSLTWVFIKIKSDFCVKTFTFWFAGMLVYKLRIKELSLCHKLWCFNPYICATQCRRL